VLNVLLGERYKNITKETQAILKGQYGATPIPVDKDLQARVLKGEKPITCRPGDLIDAEMGTLSSDLEQKSSDKGFDFHGVEDVLTYALFPQIGLKFLQNRGNPNAFEPPPGEAPAKKAAAPTAPAAAGGAERYQVTVNGQRYDVEVAPGGAISSISPQTPAAPAAPAPTATRESVDAPLAGNIFKVLVKPGQQVQSGEVLIILEAMKMETEVRAPRSGVVADIAIGEGDTVEVGQKLLELN
jgi:oxaloacetate decarboxylase alpha subunit